MTRVFLVLLVVLAILVFVVRPAAGVEFRQFTALSSGYDAGIAEPAWSPDGPRIAYTHWWVDPGHSYFLFAVIEIGNVDGSGWADFPNQLPPGYFDTIVSSPSWSPTGGRIVFTIFNEIWIGTVDDTTLVSLEISGTKPTWSPDGAQIAFTDIGGGGVYLVPSMGGTPVLRVAGANPAWSPDGRWLAYASPYGGQRDLWVVPAVGGEPRTLTHDAAVDDNPSWSPDGRFIAFGSDRSGNGDVWVVRVEDGALSQVTEDPSDDGDPVWSPDGKSIAFVSDRTGYGNIWIATDLGTIAAESVSWSRVKELFR